MKAGLPPNATPQANQGQAAIRHGVIAYAASESEALQEAMDTLYLPNLQKLLSRLSYVKNSSQAADPSNAFLMPHEDAPKLIGMAPCLGQEAIMTPCHWQVGMNEVILLKPEELALSDAESRQVLSAMQPYFEEDGLQVVYESPLVWRVTGNLIDGLPLASIERVSGKSIQTWMPNLQQAKTLQRLQSEMQMLLYQHPVNDERSLKGRWTVNSFWMHRDLDQLYPQSGNVSVALDLREAALLSNPALWQKSWQQIDNTLALSLCQALELNQSVSLTLCSENSLRHYSVQPDSWRQKLQRVFKPVSLSRELRTLSNGVASP
jgi:uncharacterized protein YigA (DUF484 family)